MIPVAPARTVERFTANGYPTPCGYRYCHAPDLPVGAGHHLECIEAETKLYSNALAAQMNMCRRISLV